MIVFKKRALDENNSQSYPNVPVSRAIQTIVMNENKFLVFYEQCISILSTVSFTNVNMIHLEVKINIHLFLYLFIYSNRFCTLSREAVLPRQLSVRRGLDWSGWLCPLVQPTHPGTIFNKYSTLHRAHNTLRS